MKKFLPGLYLFVIVFTASLAIQVGTSQISASVKQKEKSKDEVLEEKLNKIETQTINGKKINLGNIKSKITIVNFWASWCIPCMEEMPSLVSLKQKFKSEDLTIVSFNTDENDQLKNIDKTLKRFKITNEFEVIADKETKIADSLKISAIPVTYVLKNNKIVKSYNGPVDFNSVEFIDGLKKLIQN